VCHFMFSTILSLSATTYRSQCFCHHSLVSISFFVSFNNLFLTRPFAHMRTDTETRDAVVALTARFDNLATILGRAKNSASRLGTEHYNEFHVSILSTFNDLLRRCGSDFGQSSTFSMHEIVAGAIFTLCAVLRATSLLHC
jgi:hypothetical protein